MCLYSLCLFTPLAGALFSCLSSSNFLYGFQGSGHHPVLAAGTAASPAGLLSLLFPRDIIQRI